MQLRFECNLTLKEYVAQKAWRTATLQTCPLHPEGGCGFFRWGTYVRTVPIEYEIARYYCSRGRTTFSLLPDCLAARMPGTLEQAEKAASVAQREGQDAGSLEQRADELRAPQNEHEEVVGLQAAVDWMKRRHVAVAAALAVFVGMMPELCKDCEPTVEAVGRALGRSEGVLVEVRRVAGSGLARIPSPVGFCATNKGCRSLGAVPVVSSACEAGSLADKGADPCKRQNETTGRSPP